MKLLLYWAVLGVVLAAAVALNAGVLSPDRKGVGDELEKETSEEDSKEKRFYSWEGKRHLPEEQTQQKRKFYAWAGKRGLGAGEVPEEDQELPEKRKFYAWAGKRAMEFPEEEKRKFYAWAGKRSMGGAREFDKRKFYAWAGKRDPWFREGHHSDGGWHKRAETQPLEDAKRKFYAWAGRR